MNANIDRVDTLTLLRPWQAQQYLNVSRGTWRRLVDCGTVQPVNVPGLKERRYRREDLDRLYKRNG